MSISCAAWAWARRLLTALAVSATLLPAASAVTADPNVRMSTPVADAEDRSDEFSTWVAALKVEARGQGISNRTLDAAFQRVRLNTRVTELNENQPEFSRAIWDYMD